GMDRMAEVFAAVRAFVDVLTNHRSGSVGVRNLMFAGVDAEPKRPIAIAPVNPLAACYAMPSKVFDLHKPPAFRPGWPIKDHVKTFRRNFRFEGGFHAVAFLCSRYSRFHFCCRRCDAARR